MVRLEHIPEMGKTIPTPPSFPDSPFDDFRPKGDDDFAHKAVEAMRRMAQGKPSDSKSSPSSAEEDSGSESSSELPQFKPGDKFEGFFFTGKKKDFKREGTFSVTSVTPSKRGKDYKVVLRDEKDQHYTTLAHSIVMTKTPEQFAAEEEMKRLEEQLRKEEEDRQQKLKEEFEKNKISGKQYHEQLETLALAGIKNIWLVGPAGCGKTTMTEMLSKSLGVDFYPISCGIGTSSAEFIGYKYPQREPTDFATYFAKPSVILLDEFTALDPSVAQICNAALANGYINTTTGKVFRHPECIIVATSNTFGQGANRQYVANNQLDASTIDRFVGGMLEVDYSIEYESKFEKDVVNYVWNLRESIKESNLRRIASTRMIIEGEKLLKAGISDWKDILISNWTAPEKTLIRTAKSKVEFLHKFSSN